MSERLDRVQDGQTTYLKESNAHLAQVVADNSTAFQGIQPDDERGEAALRGKNAELSREQPKSSTKHTYHD